MSNPAYYLNNPNLPSASYRHAFTQHEIDEYKKCIELGPVYFTKNYVKIVHVDYGLVPFDMWDFQEDMIQKFHDERFVICKLPRQVGKTTTAIAYLLYFALFNRNVRIAILANRSATARDILTRLQLSFEYLPRFLQQGIVEWNKGSIVLANGSKIIADSTSGGSVRGQTFNIIFLDEFAHVPNNIADDFFASTYPTISSGKTTKVIIVSTPLGMNHFYRMWNDAIEGRSGYCPIEIHWSQVPGRDQAWMEETIRNTSKEQFDQEFNTEFLGSTNTLISASKLRNMTWKTPIKQDEYWAQYEEPIEHHTYVITVDTSRGQGLDYSAFSVFDVTEFPYRHVGRYRNNTIPPMLLPAEVLTKAKLFNDAFILVEVNDIGQQVADIIHYELSYDNLLKIAVKGRAGQILSPGYTKKFQMGLKTSTQAKKIGCANLKALIENDKLLTNDEATIKELMRFTAMRESYSGEDGTNDDLAMTLVLFGWLSTQRYFKEAIRTDIRITLQEEQLHIMEEDIVPIGFIDDGLNNYNEDFDIGDGEIWTPVDRVNEYF